VPRQGFHPGVAEGVLFSCRAVVAVSAHLGCSSGKLQLFIHAVASASGFGPLEKDLISAD